MTQMSGATTLITDLNGEKESRDMLWKKSQLAWMHMYHTYLDKADWFLRADDGNISFDRVIGAIIAHAADTYIMLYNLFSFLEHYNHTRPHFLGRRFYTSDENATFYSGGPGTIMSRGALKILGTTSLYYIL